jgi:hypothetical protein
MDTNKKIENASDTQNLASTTPDITNTPPPPPPAPKETTSDASLAKEFTEGVIKVLSNPPASREGSFEEDVDKACKE